MSTSSNSQVVERETRGSQKAVPKGVRVQVPPWLLVSDASQKRLEGWDASTKRRRGLLLAEWRNGRRTTLRTWRPRDMPVQVRPRLLELPGGVTGNMPDSDSGESTFD